MEQRANNRMKRAQIHTQNSEQIHSKIYTLESRINYPKITANRIWEPDINLQFKQLKSLTYFDFLYIAGSTPFITS